MDAQMENPPVLNSGEFSTSIVELSRKRKLQYELDNSALPWPKHKFRDRSTSFVHEFLISEISENIGDELEPEESEDDNNSSVGISDYQMSLDVQGKTENSSSQTFHGEPADVEVTSQLEPRQEAVKDQYPGFGGYGDCIVSEVGKYEMEFADAAKDDVMLYSNDVAPNAFLLSSGRWSLGQDARLGSRKPTIDQEFEQYFSMLMLK